MALQQIEERKKHLHEMAEEIKENPENKFLLLSLSKLQPEFYKKEFGAMLFTDKKEIAKEFFPKALEESKIEGKIEELLKVLRWTAPEIAAKYEKEITSAKTESALKKLEAKLQKEFEKR